jgi:hypothetical protein
VVITSCSIYCPVPSLPSLVVNHFRMRSSVETYSLSGMGCANGVVAVSLVRDLLQARVAAGWTAGAGAALGFLHACAAQAWPLLVLDSSSSARSAMSRHRRRPGRAPAGPAQHQHHVPHHRGHDAGLLQRQ